MPRKQMPLPRLELRWRKATPKERRDHGIEVRLVCEYRMIVPLSSKDPRSISGDKQEAYILSCTYSTATSPMDGGSLRRPYRDYMHAALDSAYTRLPAYIAHDKTWEQVDPVDLPADFVKLPLEPIRKTGVRTRFAPGVNLPLGWGA